MQNKNSKYIVVTYCGLITERSNQLLENSIVYQLKIAKKSGIKDILVSMQSVISKSTVEDVSALVAQMENLRKRLDITISFINYSMQLYRLLRGATKKTKIRLFKNIAVANLFLDSNKQGLRILVYDKDEANSKQISKELAKYDYDVIRAKDLNEFQVRMKDESDHDMIVTHSTLNMAFSGAKVKVNTLSLSKELIVNLPIFMDTAVETLVSFTGLKAKKLSHGIKRFKTDLSVDIICAVMSFEGDMDGFFTLIFPRDIAVITLESLLGEKVEIDDLETLRDGVGEFCNIITGSIKTALINKDIKIVFTLPKTYISMQETDNFISHNSGIWIDMQLADKPFYMFITK